MPVGTLSSDRVGYVEVRLRYLRQGPGLCHSRWRLHIGIANVHVLRRLAGGLRGLDLLELHLEALLRQLHLPHRLLALRLRLVVAGRRQRRLRVTEE